MTETTEEKDLIAAIERCIEGDLGPAYDLSNGLHMSPGEAAVFHKWLNGAFDKLEAQATSLTKERDELKSGAVKIRHNRDLLIDKISYLTTEKNTVKELAEEMSSEIESLKSQLSNRDKEIEKLKQNIRNFINEGEGFCPDCLDRALKDPEVDNDILRAQKSALQIHRNIKKRQDKKIESYENFKDSVLRSIKDCREIEPGLADCFENTCGIHELLASLNKEGEEE